MAHTDSPAGDASKPEQRSLKPSLGLATLLEGDGAPREPAKMVKVDVADLRERAELRKKLAETESALEKERKMRADALGMYETMKRAKERFESVPVELPASEPQADADAEGEDDEPREEPMAAEKEPSVQTREADHVDAEGGAVTDLPDAPQFARMPLPFFQKNGQSVSFAWLRGWIRDAWRRYEKLGPHRAPRTFQSWYAQPGCAIERATQIDMKRELLDRPYRDGTYYVRVRRQPDQDLPDDSFYIAIVQPRPESDVANTKLAVNMIALRTTEDLSIRLKEALDRDAAQHADITRLREEVNTLRDELAASERQCRALEDEIERLQAAGEPLMSPQAADELGVKAIHHLSKILEDPNAKTRAEFDRLRDFNRRLYDVIKMLFQGLFERPALLRDILSDAPELFDSIVQHVNGIAEEAEQQERYLASGQLMEQLKLLPPHVLPPDEVAGSDDAMLEALTEADRKIAELEARNAELESQLAAEREENEALNGEDSGDEDEAPEKAPKRAPRRAMPKRARSVKAPPKKTSSKAPGKTSSKKSQVKAPPRGRRR